MNQLALASSPSPRGTTALTHRGPAIDPVDLRACQALIRRHSRSFYFSSLLLPRAARQQAWAIYAFCRHADDTVDGDNDGQGNVAADAESDTGVLLARVGALRSRLQAVYQAASDDSGGNPLHDSPIDRAFLSVVTHTGLPQAVPEHLLRGMEMDARGQSYETWDDLLVYCFHVASTVGLMMTYVLGHVMPPRAADGSLVSDRADEVYLRACDLGVGMQLTNIARDVGEDARRGRVYLPDELLSQHGLSSDTLLTLADRGAAAPPALRRAVSDLLARADRHYEAARCGIPMLQRGGHLAIAAAESIYRGIGERLRRSGCDPLTARARVSGPGKLWRLLQVFLKGQMPGAHRLPPRRTSGPADELLRRLCQSAGVI
ncbi:MAG TPA: phytoene/squalene synthase family protein [Pseudomonadota bacterium]|nr:phytoene/squalene synthase family protein [Pseudomonadota bacterium]